MWLSFFGSPSTGVATAGIHQAIGLSSSRHCSSCEQSGNRGLGSQLDSGHIYIWQKESEKSSIHSIQCRKFFFKFKFERGVGKEAHLKGFHPVGKLLHWEVVLMISKVAVLRRGRPRDAASGIVQLNALRARWRESRWKMRLCVVARSTVEMIVLKQREVGHMGQSVSLGVLSTNESCGEQQIVVRNRPVSRE
ncbi:hypothetical protein BS47DRAFT_965772 [Hydnum rufescens UP504]|uniref:Uncharacterized protein n=1 Tax=Hydnum rufescens UP504 TaxID=1448309 RepID=A0A9P6AX75_9AGAM|nr:hypothetical protein BS47DRAFT_965772 [Hydnum rufescens UP504]